MVDTNAITPVRGSGICPGNGRANHEDVDLLGILGSLAARFVRVYDIARLISGRLANVDAIFLRL